MGKIEIIGQQPEARLPQGKFHCPECKTEQPPYGFHLAGGDLGVIGIVQYFTVFCAAPVRSSHEEDALRSETPEAPPAGLPGRQAGDTPAQIRICGCILAVNITQWQPPADPAQLAALQKAMRGGAPS